jgi:hypothetical protein
MLVFGVPLGVAALAAFLFAARLRAVASSTEQTLWLG